MEHANSPTTAVCPETQQTDDPTQSNQQQFCLRWHNHQTSLLSTLPVLLDQSQLTDVTISAEGRTLRAHRVVLSACSSFFLQLFRALDATNHPVIIIPGATFGAIVALLTFMYSGEVNVYEEQIPMLLSLAETLGIKGLADVQHNLQRSTIKQHAADYFEKLHAEQDQDPDRVQTSPSPATTPPTPSTPPTTTACHTPRQSQTLLNSATSAIATPTSASSAMVPQNTPSTNCNSIAASTLFSQSASPLFAGKLPTTPTATSANCTPLENLFLKSLQYYPNLLPQPLNFSQTALNKTSELLAKYQQYQGSLAKDFLPLLCADDYTSKCGGDVADLYGAKRFCCDNRTSGDKRLQQQLHLQQQHYTQLAVAAAAQQQQHSTQQKEQKRLDKIVENLRGSNGQQQSKASTEHGLYAAGNNSVASTTNSSDYTANLSPQVAAQKLFAFSNIKSPQQHLNNSTAFSEHFEETKQKLQHSMELYASCTRNAVQMQQTAAETANKAELNHGGHNLSNNNISNTTQAESKLSGITGTASAATPSSPHTKPPANSKLFATCFICHKQLSNQYNLRVHLETHQNVRYACNVCSHVSRSKDALRKHVSYRHPGAPSPCENEARRKRANKTALNNLPLTLACSSSNSDGTLLSSTSPTTATTGCLNSANSNSSTAATATMDGLKALNNFHHATGGGGNADALAAYMLLPKQFHLAAAAAAVAHQQQQQQQQQQQKQQSKHENAMETTDSAASTTVATSTANSSSTTEKQTNSGNENQIVVKTENPASPATTAAVLNAETTVSSSGSNCTMTTAASTVPTTTVSSNP